MEFIETPMFTKLLTYAKARKETLEPEQVAILKVLVKELERHG